MVLPFCVYLRQSTLVHLSICFHHWASASVLVLRPRDFQTLRMSSRTWATSPTMGMSAFMTLLIEEGSMSMCALTDLGLKASMRPVIRSSKRAPTLISRSQSCIAMLAS